MTSVGKEELRKHTSINAKLFHSRDLGIFSSSGRHFEFRFFPRGLGRLIPSFVAQYESMKSFNWLINRHIIHKTFMKRVKIVWGYFGRFGSFSWLFRLISTTHTQTHALGPGQSLLQQKLT